MNTRTQIAMDPELQRRAQARAAELGISFAEYVRRLLAQDLGEAQPKHRTPETESIEPIERIAMEIRQIVDLAASDHPRDISAVFDLVDEGPPTDIAHDKDKMIGEAVWEEYLEDTGRTHRRPAKPKKASG